MQKVDLAELRRLHEAATKGEWQVTRFMNIVTTPTPEDGGDIITESPNRYVLTSFEKWQSNAAFITAAHNALPSMIDELEAAREDVRELSERLYHIRQLERTLAQEKIHADRRIRNQRRELDRLPARDRRTKLIGAAEKLEQLAGVNRFRMLDCNDLMEEAAKLRQEAEGGNGNATR